MLAALVFGLYGAITTGSLLSGIIYMACGFILVSIIDLIFEFLK